MNGQTADLERRIEGLRQLVAAIRGNLERADPDIKQQVRDDASCRLAKHLQDLRWFEELKELRAKHGTQ